MDNKTKIVLSVIGISAVAVPLGLLLFLTSKPANTVDTASGSRQIDANSVNKVVKQNQKQVIYASPSPSTPSARPASEGSGSAK